MTFELSKNFHGVGIGPFSKILAVKVISPNSMAFSEYRYFIKIAFLEINSTHGATSECKKIPMVIGLLTFGKLQVILSQSSSFFYQLTQNMTTDLTRILHVDYMFLFWGRGHILG